MDRPQHGRDKSIQSYRSADSEAAGQQHIDTSSGISRAKQLRMLDFYGLENLKPETWQESQQQKRDAIENVSVQNLEKPWMEDEDADPLGIYASVSHATKRNKRTSVSRGKQFSKEATNLLSKEFDAKIFLQEVHGKTTYTELQEGYDRLSKTVEQRTEKLKSLVKLNFDRFVGAKGTVDAIYKELKVKNLNIEGYGTEEFNKKLTDVTDDAMNLFQPIIDRRLKAEKIRNTLNVLERYKFFFSLPSSLEDFIKKGRYEQAVRDIKKGKSIMTNPISGSTAGLENAFDLVWKEVDRIVEVLKNRLMTELSDMSVSVEEQERNIQLLGELHAISAQQNGQSPFDPLTFYTTKQQEFILQEISKVVSDFDAKSALIEAPSSSNLKFKRALVAIANFDYEKVFTKDKEIERFRLVISSVSKINIIMVQNIPNIHKLLKKKTLNYTLLESLLNEATTAIKSLIEPIATQGHPLNTQSIACCYFYPKIISDLIETNQKLKQNDQLSILIQQLKDTIITHLNELWIKESSELYLKFTGNDFLGAVNGFYKLFLKALHSVCLQNITQKNLELIKASFRESVLLLLDGLHFLSACQNLLTVLNLVYQCRNTCFPKWIELFVKLFNCELDNSELVDTFDHLVFLLFNKYLKSKKSKLHDIIRKGCLLSGYDYSSTIRPTDVRPYVNEALLYLVLVHAEIYSILAQDQTQGEDAAHADSKLVENILNSLITSLLLSVQENYRLISSFSYESGLQVYLDLKAILDVIRTTSKKPQAQVAALINGLEAVIIGLIKENINDLTRKDPFDEYLRNNSDYLDTILRPWRSGGQIGYQCLE